MKQGAVFLVLLVAAQCLASARAQSNFTCDDEATKVTYKRTDVVVETSTSTTGRGDQDSSQELAPLAGDHDLILGDCDADDLISPLNGSVCVPPGNGTTTRRLTVQFVGGNDEIVCIRMLDKYDNAEGEDLGGYPFVDEGGIGYDIVEMRLVSQPDQGMKFLIEIYTRVLENTTPVETVPPPFDDED